MSRPTVAEQRHRDADTFARRRRAQGAAVLLVVAAAALLAYLRPDPFGGGQEVRIAVDDAGGLTLVGGEVRMAGTPVGQVTGRDRVGDDAVLTLEIEDGAGAITTKARAEVRPRTPFEGPAYVALSPGPPSAPPLGDAVLPRARTRNYVALDRALRFARPQVRRALRRDVERLDGALQRGGAGGLRGALDAAPALTRELSVAARAARGPDGVELGRAVARMAGTVDAVAGESASLVPLARGTARTFAALGTD
ncbi:MAG TPA: MlaD family protein, partial [Baekduia sp.]|nr:MlaD family protein [Baekduia sp.]